MGILRQKISETELLHKHPIRQMGQIRKCHLVTRKVLVLGKNALIALEDGRELRKEDLDASLVGLTETLADFEDFLESDLGNDRVEVGLFNRESLHPVRVIRVCDGVYTCLLVQSPGFQIGLGRGECGSLPGVLAGKVLVDGSAFYWADLSVLF